MWAASVEPDAAGRSNLDVGDLRPSLLEVCERTVNESCVTLGSERDPAFELWGLSIRVAQVALIGVLVALLVRSARQRSDGS